MKGKRLDHLGGKKMEFSKHDMELIKHAVHNEIKDIQKKMSRVSQETVITTGDKRVKTQQHAQLASRLHEYEALMHQLNQTH